MLPIVTENPVVKQTVLPVSSTVMTFGIRKPLLVLVTSKIRLSQ